METVLLRAILDARHSIQVERTTEIRGDLGSPAEILAEAVLTRSNWRGLIYTGGALKPRSHLDLTAFFTKAVQWLSRRNHHEAGRC
jgi:hypothetical protein